MTPPVTDITTLPSLLPGIGGVTLAILLVLGAIWRGGLKEFLDKRHTHQTNLETQKNEASEKAKATDLAIAVANSSAAGSLERAMASAERTAIEHERILTEHRSLLERQERILEEHDRAENRIT